MKLVDIKNNQDQLSRNIFFNFIDKLEQGEFKDKRIQNYVGLKHSFLNYDCFTVLISNGELVAFSGLASTPFPKHLARCLTRCFYNPEFRGKTLSFRNNPAHATQYFLPYQIEYARKISKLGVFISMEDPSNRVVLKKMVDRLNLKPTVQLWKLLPDVYNTCPPLKPGIVNNSRSCWQSIAYLKLNESSTFDLQSMPTEVWKKLYTEQ